VASSHSFQQIGPALVVVASTAILVYFGTGLHPWWPSLWFAPLGALLFASRTSRWAAGATAAAGWMIGDLNMLRYYHHTLRMPPVTLVVSLAVPALLFALAVLLFRSLLRRGSAWSALLAFPAAWVSFEYLINVSSPHGTAASLAYSQLRFLPVLQFASVTGPWGISFLVFLFPACLAAAIHLRPTAPRRAWRIMAAGCGTIALILLFGVIRLALSPPGPRVRAGLISSDTPANVDVAAEGAETEQLLRAYGVQIEKLAAQGAQVVVLPEKLGVLVAPNIQETDTLLQSLADRTQATIVVGLIHVSPPVKYNEARIYAPGVPVRSYHKHHMLPRFESKLKPGIKLTELPEPTGIWGVAVCKDMDFTPLSRKYGEADTGLMLVPGWDFVVDGAEHGHMAIMRGVESGFSVVRSAKQGYLTVSDNRGRIVAEAASSSAPFAELVTDVPTGHDTTLYLLLGDWFAWLALAILVFSLAQSWPVPAGS
jgi:apolipoprotein N-acyltransferase